MTRSRVSLLALLAALGLSLASAPATAKQARFAADAAFNEAGKCESTEAFLFVTTGPLKSTKETGNVVANGRLVLEITKVDDCRGKILLHAVAKTNLKKGDLQFDGDLTSAVLNASVDMVNDVDRRKFAVDVDVTWNGTDPVVEARLRRKVEEPGRIVKTKTPVEQSLRSADAVGTMSSRGQNLVSGAAEEAAFSILLK